MRKILFVTNFYGNGGAARVMNIISEHLSNMKSYDISILSFIEYDNKYPYPQNTKQINLKSKGKVKKIFEFRRIIKSGKYDVIISFEYFINLYTILADLFIKNKLIVSERNDPKQSGDSKKNIRNFLYRFCDLLVCQTEEAKDYFPNYIQNKTIVIPNPIRQDLPLPYTGNNRVKKIVTFCRIDIQKNLKMMLDAFKIVLSKYPEYILEIYGDGNQKEELIKYSEKIGIKNNVIFKGFLQNLYGEILDYSMFISTSDFEGISNSMLEALAIGLPTICTDCPCGGARMAITHGENGLLSPVGDAKKFAENIIYLIERPELMNKFTRNSKMVKEKFDYKIICNKWETIIK